MLFAATRDLEACFLEHVGAQAPGDVNLTFTVDQRGHPQQVEIEIGEGYEPLKQCLVEVASSLEFDDHDVHMEHHERVTRLARDPDLRGIRVRRDRHR